NHTGILTERDETAFSKEITRLLEDDNATNKLVKNSRKYVNDFWTLEKSGERILNHLCQAIKHYSP
ncbi:MAG: glycosyltransferase family 1 protein, partial [Methanobacterium sp.]|nr:glycosyltransferase family 1 protein [Methanobacterium sp.]